MLFNNSNVFQVNFQTHLGVILDVKLTFEEHLKNVFNKANKTIGLLRKLSNLLPRQALVTIYKSFIRPHLDHSDVLYDQAFNNSFHAEMKHIQYNACLAITGAIRGSSREKIYQELGLESFQLRRWYRRLCLFHKVLKNEHPKYLFHLIPVRCTSYATLLSTICSLDSKLLDSNDYDLTQTLLFGSTSQTSSNNFKIINASSDYIYYIDYISNRFFN